MNSDQVRRLARKGVFDVEAWPAGKPLEEVRAELGRGDIALMATNENPLGPSPKAVEAMQEAIRRVNVYPDGPCVFLKRKVASRLGVTPQMVTFASGADSCIRMVASAFVNDGEEVIMADPTFPVYATFVTIMGGIGVYVPLQEHAHDLEAMSARVGPRTKLVFVCNPNNPTGTIVTRKQLETLVDRLPPQVVLVIDEAYFEFVSDPDYPNGLDYVRDGRNVIVLRTFSKLYGLAGLRIGYAVAAPEMIDVLERVREPYVVSGVAQAAALAALDDQEFVARVLDNNERGKDFFHGELGRLGLEFVPSHTNFVFVDLRREAKGVVEALLRQGLMVRHGSPWNLPTCVRITFGTDEQNRRLVAALEKVLVEGR